MKRLDHFPQWLANVRQAFSSLFPGLDLDDLPDPPFGDWFEAGLTPTQAARRAVHFAQGIDD